MLQLWLCHTRLHMPDSNLLASLHEMNLQLLCSIGTPARMPKLHNAFSRTSLPFPLHTLQCFPAPPWSFAASLQLQSADLAMQGAQHCIICTSAASCSIEKVCRTCSKPAAAKCKPCHARSIALHQLHSSCCPLQLLKGAP